MPQKDCYFLLRLGRGVLLTSARGSLFCLLLLLPLVGFVASDPWILIDTVPFINECTVGLSA